MAQGTAGRAGQTCGRCVIAAAAAAVVCGGCHTWGWCGAGAARLWPDDLQGAVADPGEGYGVEFSWDFLLAARLGHYVPEHGQPLTVLSAGFDPAEFIMSGMGGGHYSDENMFLIVEPLVGYWSWRDAPERDGLLTGIRLGFRLIDELDGRRMRAIALGWQHL